MKAWMQAWEESERGWGVRPDGYWFYATEEKARKGTEALLKKYRNAEAKEGYGLGNAPDEYSRPSGDPVPVDVGKQLAAEIRKSGRAFRLYRKDALV